ncbi:YlbG family protein [Listeria costaricensis]|uniref:YlbG family protein n=1 Tax=Listeria costaricensis TaxID=2026604 RepID=UPI000C07BE0D|nr:YlbG family protein [Listeria costaricensis]
MENDRQAIVIWLNHLKQVRSLKRFGNVHYVSRKLKYAVLYCNMCDVEEISAKIARFHYVKRVEPSFRPFLKTEYESKIESGYERKRDDVQISI